MESGTPNTLFLPLLGTALIALVFLGLWVWTLFKSREDRRQLRALEDELREKEDLLIQARRMEAVGILAGSIVHNLNNLLAVILGHTRMA